MATSSKTTFKLADLQVAALKSIDERIADQQLVVASYDDEAALAQRQAEWRAAQEERVSHLFSRLGGKDLSDEELARFEIQPRPKIDRWDKSRAQQTLRDLERAKSRIVAKSSALTADADGNIALTATQLREFFGL